MSFTWYLSSATFQKEKFYFLFQYNYLTVTDVVWYQNLNFGTILV